MSDPTTVTLKIEDLIDSRFVRELDENGFIDWVYGAQSGR